MLQAKNKKKTCILKYFGRYWYNFKKMFEDTFKSTARDTKLPLHYFLRSRMQRC